MKQKIMDGQTDKDEHREDRHGRMDKRRFEL